MKHLRVGFVGAIRTLVLSCVIASSPLGAQFADFSSSANGGQFYFTSSLRLSGSAPRLTGTAIYRVAESGLQLFMEDATWPQVSADGRTVGSTRRDGIGELRGIGGTELGRGMLSVSRNARWALLSGPPKSSPGERSDSLNLSVDLPFYKIHLNATV